MVFSATWYSERREELCAQLRSAGANGIILLPGHAPAVRTYPDNAYPFRQESTLLYYTGDTAAHTALTIDIDTCEATLWGHEPTMDSIVWCGPQPTLAERAALCGCEHQGPLEELGTALAKAQKAARPVHLLPVYRGDTVLWLQQYIDLSAQELAAGTSMPLLEAVVAQRSVKLPEEVAEIEQALDISYQMYDVAMQLTAPGNSEQDIAGVMAGVVASHASQHAFTTICSVRGEVLHNHTYGNTLKDGDLLLIDSGAESPGGYASDITRTLPVSGAFSARQRDVYTIVLAAQQAAIEAAAPGVTFAACHQASARILTEGLKELGLLVGETDGLLEQGAFALFCPHGLGHALGLDVHDMESFGEDNVGYSVQEPRDTRTGYKALRFGRTLQEGFCLTVEPGLYMIPQLQARWKAHGVCKGAVNYSRAEAFAGFGGIRIEDDILITPSGCRVLGTPIPKTITEIEHVMNAGG